jgi:hypothetical protein
MCIYEDKFFGKDVFIDEVFHFNLMTFKHFPYIVLYIKIEGLNVLKHEISFKTNLRAFYIGL